MNKALKYFIKTPWYEIITDFHDYNALRKEYSKAKKEFRNKKSWLTNDLGETETNVCDFRVGCKIICNVSYINPMDGDLIPNFFTQVCDNFSLVDRCKKKNCSYYRHNDEYFTAVEKFKTLEKQKSSFWKEKFSRMK